jgi:hypothetical protein
MTIQPWTLERMGLSKSLAVALSCPAPKPQLSVGGPGEAEKCRGRFQPVPARVKGAGTKKPPLG